MSSWKNAAVGVLLASFAGSTCEAQERYPADPAMPTYMLPEALVTLDGAMVGTGRVGPVTRRLMELYELRTGGANALAGGALSAPAAASQLSHSMAGEIAAARQGGGLSISGPGQRIGEIVDSNPEEAAGIIRNWMSESAA
jgi:hypothetical protein